METKFLPMIGIIALLGLSVHGAAVQVSSLEELMAQAALNGNEITMAPGTYAVNAYLTPERLAAVRERAKTYTGGSRPPGTFMLWHGWKRLMDLTEGWCLANQQ